MCFAVTFKNCTCTNFHQIWHSFSTECLTALFKIVHFSHVQCAWQHFEDGSKSSDHESAVKSANDFFAHKHTHVNKRARLHKGFCC